MEPVPESRAPHGFHEISTVELSTTVALQPQVGCSSLATQTALSTTLLLTSTVMFVHCKTQPEQPWDQTRKKKREKAAV